jgi:hypothetical protein
MSIFLTDLRDAGMGVLTRLRSGAATLRRTTPAVLSLRLLVFGGLLGAVALSVPLTVLLVPVTLVVASTVALAAALYPRTRAVGFAVVTIGVAWLASTAFLDVRPAPGRVLGLAAALYVAHAAAAFAAVLPNDAAVAPSALLRWARRTAGILAIGLGLGGGGLVAAAWLPLSAGLVAPLLGSVAAAGVVGVIVWLARRATGAGE